MRVGGMIKLCNSLSSIDQVRKRLSKELTVIGIQRDWTDVGLQVSQVLFIFECYSTLIISSISLKTHLVFSTLCNWTQSLAILFFKSWPVHSISKLQLTRDNPSKYHIQFECFVWGCKRRPKELWLWLFHL